MGKDWTGCAGFCQVLSMVAVPLLAYFGYLASVGSELLEIPKEKKPEAATGCYIAAAMYVAVRWFCL